MFKGVSSPAGSRCDGLNLRLKGKCDRFPCSCQRFFRARVSLNMLTAARNVEDIGFEGPQFIRFVQDSVACFSLQAGRGVFQNDPDQGYGQNMLIGYHNTYYMML